jgi:predicted metalloprotease
VEGAGPDRVAHPGRIFCRVTANRWLAAVGSVLCVLAACATSPGVATQSAERLASPVSTTAPPPATTEPPPSTTQGPFDPPATSDPGTTDSGTAAPGRPPGGELLGDRLDVGDAKPPRDYDAFLRLALNDLERWWAVEYPATYGEPFEPLAGSVYAGYPERTTPIPGCGTDEPTPYRDIALFSAFYCAEGDFMVYDDGADGVLHGLAAEFGSATLGVVFAHEYGHAVQARAGVLGGNRPTIVSEQQADCFAGAWVAHAHRGEAEGITFSDQDIRSGLIAMITVRDPVGIDTLQPGGHGSAFDRVGAFQTGFQEGTARCAELADDPLPLVPNTFDPGQGPSDGDSLFEEVIQFVPADAQQYWDAELAAVGATMPVLTVVGVPPATDFTCAEPAGSIATGAVYCPETQEVLYDEALARDLYGRFGDFVVGFIIGGAFSEAAQVALDSPLAGEERFLATDCLTGAWSQTMIPTLRDPQQGRTAFIEPGDLDEAIQAALVLGDDAAGDDVLGSGFEKIAAFREGVLDGLDACLARLTD